MLATMLGAAGLLTATLFAPDASAALTRYSASNNRIYVYSGGDMNLSAIAADPGIPATALQHDAASGTWLLTANIVVQDGTTLHLTSDDIKVLRLQSNASSAPATDVTNFISITADYGNIDIKGITITSWDTGASAPDTNVADGRAFIRARSSQDPATGAALVSRMDVVNSDVGYLGWDASESYGLSWKANGDLAVVSTAGNVTGSHIHHNEFGVYTFGLKDGQWTGNEVDHNIGYGFDGHDDTDNVIIDSNNVHDNGIGSTTKNHGIILSERCDHAQITNNTSSNNGGNGIMLHDLSNDAVVQNNTVANNGDSGIALFCSTGTNVKNNTVTGNANGIRLSVAADGNTVEGNTFSGSTQYGIYMYKGTDSNGICGSDLVPNTNTFKGNTVSGSATNGVKITEGDQNTFDSNTFNDGLSIKNSAFTAGQTYTFVANTFGPGVVLSLDGSASTPLVANISKTAHVSMHADTGATGHFTDDQGAIFDLARDILVDVNGTNSVLDVTASNAGAPDFVVDTRPLRVNAGGGTAHVAPTLWETSGEYRKTWIVQSDAASNSIGYTVGDLKPNVTYDVARGSDAVGSFTADGSGTISFSDATGTTTTVTYALTQSAVQANVGGGGGGGGGGALDLEMLVAMLLGGALIQRRRNR